MNWLKKYLAAITGETYTFVGLLIAYATLEGSAKAVTGYIIIIGALVWLVSLPLRDSGDE